MLYSLLLGSLMELTLPLAVSQLTPYHRQWFNATFSSQPSLTDHLPSFPPVPKKSDINPSLSAASAVEANKHHQYKSHAVWNHEKGDTLWKCALNVVPTIGVTNHRCATLTTILGINSCTLHYLSCAGMVSGKWPSWSQQLPGEVGVFTSFIAAQSHSVVNGCTHSLTLHWLQAWAYLRHETLQPGVVFCICTSNIHKDLVCLEAFAMHFQRYILGLGLGLGLGIQAIFQRQFWNPSLKTINAGQNSSILTRFTMYRHVQNIS